MDHARWLSPDESWEEPTWTTSSAAITGEDKDRREFEELLAGMSDEEVQDLMAQLGAGMFDGEEGEGNGEDEQEMEDEAFEHDER
jgi:hypothetical protein